MTQTIPTAEPFLLMGDASRPACLLVHGFTGTPKEMRWLGEFLNRHGHTCLAPRLTGHATRPEDMIRSNWTDWTASVEDGYNLLRCLNERIIIVGLSMGGILSLLMASKLDVIAAVAMSAPYRLPDDRRLRHIDLIARTIPYMPKGSDATPGAGWFDKEAWKDHVSYPQNPVRSIGQLNQLLAEMRAALPRLLMPILLIHSKDDDYVLPENLELIFNDLVNAPDRTKHYVAGSGHVLTRDAARQEVFQHILDFLRRIDSSQVHR